MGCSSSKPADDNVLDPADVKVAENYDAAPGYTVTHSGFKSDVQQEKGNKGVADVLVQRNKHKVREVYDVDGGVELGHGACGRVIVAKRRSDGCPFAMKTVNVDMMSGASMDELRNEIEVQKSLDHPNIVRIYEYFEERDSAEMHIIMELCTGGSLVSRMKTHRHGYGEAAAATLVEKMLSAVFFCHSHQVVHRDIKLDNFIYENEREDAELKLIDFGFAAHVKPGAEGMYEQIGTPSYMAPELCSKDAKMYDSSVDMWALGVVTFMLLSGKRPFHHQDREEKRRRIIHDPLSFDGPEWKRISPEAKDFISALMQKQPSKRLAASQAQTHAWIKNASTLHVGTNAADELSQHEEVVASLQSFAVADDIKKVALEVMAFTTPANRVEELREIFVKIDENGSGTISKDEFRRAMAKQNVGDVDQLFNMIDSNGSGEIEYMEFLGATVESHNKVTHGGKPSILSAFAVLDSDGDGVISAKELHAFMGKDYSLEEINKMIIQVGGSAGEVSLDAFKSMMLQDLGSMARDDLSMRAWTTAQRLTGMAEERFSTSQKSLSEISAQ